MIPSLAATGKPARLQHGDTRLYRTTAMGYWTLDDIPWEKFDRSKVDPDLLRIVKAASLVEYDGEDYARYLCRVFHDDPEFQETARRWGGEEEQHGRALGRWAQLADPGYDLDAAFQRFKAGYDSALRADVSKRGSRAGEMIARCMVETGTSSYYTALAEAAEEPVLKAICQRIAADELRHYKLFYSTARRYIERERLGLWGRLKVALSRVAESDDDELAYAYYAANQLAGPYDRRRHSRAYAARAYRIYRRHHVERGIAMILKAVGLSANGRLQRLASAAAWRFMRLRIARFARAAA
jgi:rubrerythrin